MQINGIHIKNFRCFKDFTIEFGQRATVIFGKNGSGKSSLINALHKALSFIMYSDKVYKRVKGKRVLEDVRTIANNNRYLKVEGFSNDGDFNNTDDKLIEIEATATLDADTALHWIMSAFTTNGHMRPTGFIEAFRTFYDWHLRTDKLPVIAYYSDSFPHKEDTKRDSTKSRISTLRNFGYFDWNDQVGCTKEWVARLGRTITNIRQTKDKIEKLKATEDEARQNATLISTLEEKVAAWTTEFKYIEDTLRRFSKGLTADNNDFEIAAIDLHSLTHRLCINTQTGEEFDFEYLPAGYKRLYAIVLDLAYRIFILNRNDVTLPGQGIAMIDEIDLHLHPQLESAVLNKLLETFPEMQFIVTTHSINVLTNLRTADGRTKILRMQKGSPSALSPGEIYGMDVSSGQSNVMDVIPTNDELEYLIDECAYMQSNQLLEQCENLKRYIIGLNLISAQEINNRIANALNNLRQ